MPTKANAARIAPCRQAARETDAITKTAKIQMVIASLKIILQKMHDQNWGPGDGRDCKGRNTRYVCRVKISVIVPAFNEEKLLGASLAGIQAASRAFTRLAWEFELIVCDNNSADQTAAIARAAGATVIFEPFNQIARARNTGASARGATG